MIILISDFGGKGIIMALRLQARLDHYTDCHRNLGETEFHPAVYEGAREWIELVAVLVEEKYD